MSDGSWVRSVNNKGIYTGGQVKGGTVRADGRLYTGEYLQLERTAVAGASCSPNGLVGRDNTGAILSCQSGTWGTLLVENSMVLTANLGFWGIEVHSIGGMGGPVHCLFMHLEVMEDPRRLKQVNYLEANGMQVDYGANLN
ncbi:hypothetical protein Ef22C057LT_44730 (plasmid) [Escherichia fergusonii]|nr:hypothetical protein Ef22C057LT_44730 [Escherichia fergusonii]